MVDDHVDTSSAMRRLLAHLGHQVQVAGSVSTALEVAGEGPFDRSFDLLISDIGLPDGTGLELMTQLRARCGEVRGIALSGLTGEDDVSRSQAAGFREHLAKPVSLPKLEEAIRRVAQRT
jgi:CheY-like chemotaxis protein